MISYSLMLNKIIVCDVPLQVKWTLCLRGSNW